MAGLLHRRLVTALWVLLRSAGARAAEAQVRDAAADCLAQLTPILAEEPHWVLQQRGGALFANGLRIRPDVAAFAATAGLAALLQDNRVGELSLLRTVTVADLVGLARCWHQPQARGGLDALLAAAGHTGVHVRHTAAATAADETPATAANPPSQLGAVFAMQRLAAALGPLGATSAVRARAVLQTVLHELLRTPGLLEPLLQPLADPSARAAAVRACVLAVLTAEELGWPDPRSLAAGQAALTGTGLAAADDAEVAELARAARAIAALLGPAVSLPAAIQTLQQQGTVADGLGAAMTRAALATL